MRVKPAVRTALAFVVAAAGLAMVPSAQAVAPPDKEERGLLAKAEADGPQRVIVEFAGPSERSSVLGDLKSADVSVQIKAKFRYVPMVAMRADAAGIERLLDSPDVVKVHRDTVGRPGLDSTTRLINADDVHRRGFTGTGRTVAVLDTGIDRDHPFFGDRIVDEACYSDSEGDNRSLCPNGRVEQTGDGAANAEIDVCRHDGANICDHGSHVAGIAAGARTEGAPANGVAPGTRILPMQVFFRRPNNTAGTYESDQILALERVFALRNTYDIASVNMSIYHELHGERCDDDSRRPIIRRLLDAGIVTVIISGNEGEASQVTAPGCITEAVTVGATDDDDEIADFSNRGAMLDLFAPGDSVNSAIPEDAGDGGDDQYENKDGTSMAAPHVAGAFALLRERFPGNSPAENLRRLRETGVPIQDGDRRTPRIDLGAAVPALPPSVDAGGPYETVEGTPVRLRATARNADRVAWDFDGDGAYDDATGLTPSYERVGQDGVSTVSVRATGTGGTATDSARVTVTNAPPRVEFTTNSPVDENGTVRVTGRVVDPGWLDELTATIDWGDGTRAELGGRLENDRPDATLSFETTHVYGDNGDFTVKICGADDDTERCTDHVVRVDNVDPRPAIDKSQAVDTPEGPTIIARRKHEVELNGRVTDPGSDDLAISWDYGDGDPSPDKETTSLVNPPNADPPKSPSVQPRDVADNAAVTYRKACVYNVTFAARDDDNGRGSDGVAVVVQDNGLVKKLATLWYVEFLVTSLPPEHLPDDILACYLDIAEHMSGVFGEVRDAGSIAEARDVLKVRLFPTGRQELDRQLLAAWLNFAHGPFGIDERVDTDCDLHADTTFHAAMRRAEAVRLDPNATDRALHREVNRMESLNLCNPL